MDDLLQLLLTEFDIDVEAAREAMQAACNEPARATEHLEFVGDFLSRSGQAVELAGLVGLGQYLVCVNEVRDVASQTGDAAMLGWLPGWVDAARSYLATPAAPQTVSTIVDHLSCCPLEVVQGVTADMAELLATAPAMSDEFAGPTEPDIAQPADVSIDTRDTDPGLLGAMLADAPDQLDQLRTFIAKLARDEATTQQTIEAQRVAHTLKGSGNIVGVIGIGRIAHYLENLLEWAANQVKQGASVPKDCTRDMTFAVDTLHDMVAALNGDQTAPAHAMSVLQRLMDWSWHIATGQAQEYQPNVLQVAIAEPDGNLGADDTNAPQASAAAASSVGNQTVRVDSERLGRLLRRAGQSLYSAQRMTQFIDNAQQQLEQAALKQRSLEARLRELQTYVDSQVVNLRATKESGGDFDPLEMDRYDAMYSLSRFISEDVADQTQCTKEALSQLERSRDVVRDEQAQLTLQHRDLVDARMVAVKTLTPRLRRNVAQTAAALGKEVELVVEGETTTADADVLTRLTEPLLHLVRNAVDHGIERGETRLANGKTAAGTVWVSFRQLGSEIEVTVRDDGRGLDAYAIHQKAIEFGLVDDSRLLDQAEIYRLILLPGFSTKSDVTEISGRGVGMDVVNDRVLGMKGRLRIDSTPGQGSRFTMLLPVSTSAAKLLLVESAGTRVGLPIESINQALAPDQFTLQNGQIVHEGIAYRAVSLENWLGFAPEPHAVRGLQSAVIVHASEQDTAVLVDRVIDVREVVLQDAGPLLRRVSGLIAATLREDGEPMFVLDTNALSQAAKPSASVQNLNRMRARTRIERTRVMVVDDALSVRRAMRQLLEDSGYEAVVCVDGQEALQQLEKSAPSIVLTDLEMPIVNGMELTQRIRAQSMYKNLPVIMITSRASDKHRDAAYEAGVSLFLTKPYSDIELLAHIRERATGVSQSALI